MIGINSRNATPGPDPQPDHELGDLLRAHLGVIPDKAVDWTALSHRIAAGVTAHAPSPWWSYAARWERRVIPIALAAGIAASAALWNTQVATSEPADADIISALVEGTPKDEVVRQFARSVTSTAVDLTEGVPE